MSKIEWTDETWSPIRGCNPVSPGCARCWAARMANRHRSGAYKGFVENGKWTGRVELIPDQLEKPLHWRKPRRIAVALMGDLFHARLTTEDIAAVFGVMAACPQHTFQVLTKRPERMREWFKWVLWWTGFPHDDKRVSHVLARHTFQQLGIAGSVVPLNWPLPNVHLAVSVEDQATADERIPLLLQTPAAVRWVSYEPALGPVDLSKRLAVRHVTPSLLHSAVGLGMDTQLDWLAIGGESGPGARPCNVEWVRSAVRQCQEAGVACFVKQLGAKPMDTTRNARLGLRLAPGVAMAEWNVRYQLKHPKGGDPAEWPSDLRIREFPG